MQQKELSTMTNLCPTVERPQSSVKWMNQISDKIGTFLPFGDQIPSRHPLKVSLVMGLLGLASGGLTGLSHIAIQTQIWPPIAQTILTGCIFGLLVVLPLMRWTGASRSTVLWATAYISIIPAAVICIQVHDMLGGTIDFSYFSIVVPFAIVWGVCSYWLERRFSSRWLICLMFIGLAMVFVMRIALFPFINLNSVSLNLQIAISILCQFSVQQWYFYTQHIVVSILLGMILWDRSPRPKYELLDPAAPDQTPQIDPGKSQ